MRVSIVIPVKNEAKNLRACLQGWFDQTVVVEQIVVIDSGSTDGTLDIARSFEKVTLIEIPSDQFNHGTTRNQAVSHVKSGLTMMTVGDARPVDRYVLERMQECFADPNVAGVCGMQVVPHERDKNPVEWFRPQSEPVTQNYCYPGDGEYDALVPGEMHRVTGWDDVVAMYRTDVLQKEIPYREINYGEDIQWAQEAYRAGYALAYCPAARVFHYHLEDASVTIKRAITVSYLRYKMFGFVPNRPLLVMPVLRATKVLLKEPGLKIGERWRWLSHTIGNQFALRSAISRFLTAVESGDDAVERLQTEFSGKQFKLNA